MTKTEMPTLDQIGPPLAEADDAAPAPESGRRRGRRRAASDPAGPSPAGASDAAPKTRKPRASSGAATAKAATTKVRGMLSTFGAVLAMAGPQHEVASRILVGNEPAPLAAGDGDPAQRFSEAIGKLAAENPRVRRVIDGLQAGGVWGEVVLASAALFLPIAASYGLLPPRVTAALFPAAVIDHNAAGAPASAGEPFAGGPIL